MSDGILGVGWDTGRGDVERGIKEMTSRRSATRRDNVLEIGRRDVERRIEEVTSGR